MININILDYKKATNKDLYYLAKLGANSFVDNIFYSNLEKQYESIGNHNIFIEYIKRYFRLNQLKITFRKSIKTCLENGIVKVVKDKNNICAFVLAFNYHKMQLEHKDNFLVFFKSRNKHMQEKLNKIKYALEDTMCQDLDYIYLLAIVVDPKYRCNGIAKKIIEDIENCYKEYAIIIDVSNKIMANICIKLEFKNMCQTIDGCEIFVKTPIT